MKYLRSIYFWTIGGLVFGLILISTISFSYFLPASTYDPWVKKMLRFMFKLIHTSVEVEGSDNVQKQGPYIFMANHVSIFDTVLLGGYVPTFIRGIEADRQHKWPLYGWAVRRYGNIPIARESFHGSIRSFRKVEKYLQEGNSIVILPEGHRTLDGKLGEFKKLPFFFAKQAAVDLVPIGMSGLFRLKRKGNWHIQPTTIKIKFGNIITAEEIASMSVIALRDRTRAEIESLVERP